MATRNGLGVFCVEHWGPRLTETSSVEPLLSFLCDLGRIRYIHCDIADAHGLRSVLEKWRQRQYADYSVGYFGFHGSPGMLHLGRERVDLLDLAEVLNGACAGKTIYFGSCAVLDVPRREIEEFRRLTRVRCIAGYRHHVDWMESTAFDLLLFDTFSRYKRIDAIERHLFRDHGQLARHLGFKLYH